MFRIYPFKLGSESARRLKEVLGGRPLLKPDGVYRPREGDVIINWGSARNPNFLGEGVRMLNLPEHVEVASNKLSTLVALSRAGVTTIPFTSNQGEASSWDGTIYVRNELRGHSGEGIVIIGQDDEVPPAPLYTKAIDNQGEYRIHVMNGEVFDYRKKSRMDGDEPTEDQSKIRTLGNGWIYRQGNLRRLERVEELAIQAINALNLDFGAVDIIMDANGDVFVLEVNTAVGLADNTLESYQQAFERHYA